MASSSSATLFKDLKKLVSNSQQQRAQSKSSHLNSQAQKELKDRLYNKPFWIWSKEEHREDSTKTQGNCCFNHIIGLPQKEGVDKPLYDYEELIFQVFANLSSKHIWIKKATGLGVSEFMLRFMAWLCLKDDALSGSQMCIVTGPRIELAIALIDRMKGLFRRAKESITFNSKETVIDLNNVKIEAFPSHHLDAMRGITNVSFILLDEADFFPPGQQQDARDVSERYIAKSNPYIVLVSTPNAPEGLFERIEKEAEDVCLYKRMFLDYSYGVGKIYTSEEIENAKKSPSFEREYNLKYLGRIGNVFHTKDIELAVNKGMGYDPETFNPYSHFTSVSMGIDPGYGSSAFGIVVTQWEDDHIQVLYAEEHNRPDYNEMLSVVHGLMSTYQIDKVYIDGANPSFIRSLKLQIGEDPDYETVIARYRTDKLGDSWTQGMKIIPVHFNAEHKEMLGHAKMIFEDEGGHIKIHPSFDKLITALRTAVDVDGTLDKEATSYDDCFDAFRLALKFYSFRER